MNSSEFDYSYHYRKWHPDTPDHASGMEDYYRHFLKGHLPASKDARILEVGCGMGFALSALTGMGYSNVEGMDICDEQLKISKAKGLRVQLVADTPKFLEERRGTYDLILAFDVIEHMPREQQWILTKAIYAALAPGGKLVCTVPNANSAIFSRWLFNDFTHHSGFTEISLDFLLHSAGFSGIRILNPEIPPSFSASRFHLRRILKKRFWMEVSYPVIFRLMRFFRRLEMISELGWDEGRTVILSLNLLGVAVKA